MVGVLIVSHGRLAEALISEVQFLNGNLQRVKGVSVWPKESEEEARDRIRKKMAEVDGGGWDRNLNGYFRRDADQSQYGLFKR